MRTDEQTDKHDKANSFFRNFASAPEHKIRTGRSWRSLQTFLILIFPTPQCTWNSFIADTNRMSQGKSHCRTRSALFNIVYNTRTYCWHKCKDKSIPSQAWTGPWVSRRLRLPYFKAVGTWRWYGQPYAPAAFTPPPLPPRKYTWYPFLLEAEYVWNK